MLHTEVTEEWFSPTLKCRKWITVLVPPDHGDACRRSPLLILLHGYGGNRRTWIEHTRLIDRLAGRNLVVVLPESGRRWFINDYMGYRYEDYLINEVIPFAQDRFNTIPDRLARAIGGFSMGGAAALMQAFRHSDVFSAAASHAGAFEAPARVGDPYAAFRDDCAFVMPSVEVHERVWGPAESAIRQRYDIYSMIDEWPGERDLSVYADVGSNDFERVVEMNRRTVVKLRGSKIPVEYHERAGGHDFKFLDQAVSHSAEFLLRHLLGRGIASTG